MKLGAHSWDVAGICPVRLKFSACPPQVQYRGNLVYADSPMVLCLDCYLVLFRCMVWFFSYTSYTQELWKPQSEGENMCLYRKRGACTFFSMSLKPVEGDCTFAMEPYSTAVEGVIQGTRFASHESSESRFLQHQPLCIWKWTHMPEVMAVDCPVCFVISCLLIRNPKEASRPGAEFVGKEKEWYRYFSRLGAETRFHLKINCPFL